MLSKYVYIHLIFVCFEKMPYVAYCLQKQPTTVHQATSLFNINMQEGRKVPIIIIIIKNEGI